MASVLPFTGSKRKARQRERDQRRLAAFTKRMARIQELAGQIQTESQFREILQACPDDAMRAELAKLLEPLLLFRIGRVTLAPGETFHEIGTDGRSVIDALTGKPILLEVQ